MDRQEPIKIRWLWTLAALLLGAYLGGAAPTARADDADSDCLGPCQTAYSDCAQACDALRESSKRGPCINLCFGRRERCVAACPRPLQP